MDEQLRILDIIVLPPELDALDDRILGALPARRKESAAIGRLMALSALASLGGGVIAGSAFPDPAVAASPLSPFGPASALAPSTLLDSQ